MRQESAYDCASFYCDKGRRMVGGGQEQKMTLEHAVFLDGDWCWDAQPFVVNEETKAMVIRNICFLLNNFLHCSAYENIIFCWVMHEQEIIDSIVGSLDMENCQLKCISLLAGGCNTQEYREDSVVSKSEYNKSRDRWEVGTEDCG